MSSDYALPNYTRREEIFNMVSHIVGGGMGVVALVMCATVAAWRHNAIGIVTSLVFGLTMILLYTMSSIYHGLTNEKAKKVFRVLDHCTIYLLIAGTYTPLLLGALREVHAVMAWTLFGVVWGLALLAVTLTAVSFKRSQTFSMVCYIVMGWCVVIAYEYLIPAFTLNGVLLLLSGGISYTVGAVLYGIGKKRKYFHGVFHLFVLLGSFFHFLCIVLYAF